MAKWLREYFNFGNYKARSPPQPPKPDYSKKKYSSESAYQESDLMRAYRLQKEKDFEDPYNNGPGSSLRRLRAMCQEHPEDEKREKWDKSTEKRTVTNASPHLYRSNSERKAGSSPNAKYISPKHRLIKVDSTPVGDHKIITWSPSANSKKLHKSENNAKKEKLKEKDFELFCLSIRAVFSVNRLHVTVFFCLFHGCLTPTICSLSVISFLKSKQKLVLFI